MPLGTTNIGINSVYTELGFNPASNLSLKKSEETSWIEGPPPGANTYSYIGFGLNNITNDQLYNPVVQSGSFGLSSNYKLGYAKNLQAYMDGTSYYINVDVRNNLGGMMDNATFDTQLWDESYTYGPIAGGVIGPVAAGMTQNGNVDNPSTYNVYYGYFVLKFDVSDPMTNYTIDIDVNGNTYNAGGLTGGMIYQIDSTNLSGLPINNGNGFTITATFS